MYTVPYFVLHIICPIHTPWADLIYSRPTMNWSNQTIKTKSHTLYRYKKWWVYSTLCVLGFFKHLKDFWTTAHHMQIKPKIFVLLLHFGLALLSPTQTFIGLIEFGHAACIKTNLEQLTSPITIAQKKKRTSLLLLFMQINCICTWCVSFLNYYAAYAILKVID